MFEIIIKQPNIEDKTLKLVPGVYRMGSSPAAHIQIIAPDVSGQHAQLIVSNSDVKIVNVKGIGTFLDGTKVESIPITAKTGSTITIGNAELLLKGPDSKDTVANIKPEQVYARVVEEKQIQQQIKPKVENIIKVRNSDKRIPVLRVSNIPTEVRPLVQEIKRRVHIELLKRLNLKRMAVAGTSDEELREQATKTIHDILTELTIPLPPSVSLGKIEKEIVNEAIGLGPLEDLIAMDNITEIMVNGPNFVYVELNGKILRTDTAFADENQVLAAIERIVAPLGRRIDESSPMVDARLPDGSRVNAVIPPLSLAGPSITIRKFSKDPFQAEDLVRFGSISPEVVKFLDICVQVRKNIIISGGTGSGKTTLLNVLSSFLPNTERIVTIEDAAELQLRQEHVVRLESRPPNIEGRGAITIRDLVRNSLRMRPDRIVVGECRGGEALDMLQAMNTGHDGSLTTVHANSPRDALSRLETLVLMAGFDLPLRAIREQISSAIKIVVQITREKDGTRKLTNVSEITKMEGDVITMQDIFVFKQEGWNDDDKIVGKHVATGNIPTFMEEIKRAKLDLDISMFNNGEIY